MAARAHTSIVMVSYRTGFVLWPAIRAVLRQPECKELILVDNGNSDAVVFELRRMAEVDPRLIIISGHGNVGFARGCNIGAKYATGEYLLLLNPDCMLPERAIFHAVEALTHFDGAMLAGALLVDAAGQEQRGARRNLLTPRTALVESLSLHRFFPSLARLNRHETTLPVHSHEVEAISGAFMLLRRADYEHVQGMDEGYFLHVEDLDFCLRVRAAGRKIISVPGVRVLHAGATSDASSWFVEWCKARSFARYFRTHFGAREGRLWVGLATLGIWARCGMKCVMHSVRRYCTRQDAAALTMRKTLLLRHMLDVLPQSGDHAGRSVIVTGATGQIGLCLLARLLAGGAQVTAMTRGAPLPVQHEHLRWVQGEDPHVLRGHGIRASVLIDSAPLWFLPPKLEGFFALGVSRVIAFGSTSQYVKALSENAHERNIVLALDAAQNEVKRLCERAGAALTLFHPTLIYGLGLDTNITRVAQFIRRFGFFMIYPPARGIRRPVHADDLARAALAALAQPVTQGRDYALSGAEALGYRDMIGRIFHALGRRPRFLALRLLPALLDLIGATCRKAHVNGAMARRMNDDLNFDHDAAQADFGFAARAFLMAQDRELAL